MSPLNERIAIVGGGRVGSALMEAFTRARREAQVAPRDAAGSRKLVAESGIVVLAIPFEARREVVDAHGDALHGKVVVDVTNPLRFPGPEFTRGEEPGAVELQRWLPRAKVVKAFNTVFSPSMATGRVGGQMTSAFVAADDAEAKRLVLALAKDMGLDAVDAGPLVNADHLERLLFFEMMLEKVHGSAIGWRLLRG